MTPFSRRSNGGRIGTTGMVAVVLMCGGCGNKSFLNENDDLRAEVLRLKDENGALSGRMSTLERQIKIEQSQKGLNLPQGVVRPLAVEVRVGSYSGGIDTDKDGHDDTVRIYFKTLDARGRFILTVGSAAITIVAIQPGEDAITVGRIKLSPKAFDDAYRSSLTGTHHTLECPIRHMAVPENTTELTARASFKDYLTGKSFEHEAIIPWKGR
jgi:hypothetical protein